MQYQQMIDDAEKFVEKSEALYKSTIKLAEKYKERAEYFIALAHKNESMALELLQKINKIKAATIQTQAVMASASSSQKPVKQGPTESGNIVKFRRK